MINTFARNTTLRLRPLINRTFSTGGFPAPRLFDYETVTANLSVPDAISAVENCFAALGRDAVEVPMPMHIGIDESKPPSESGPGDCHVKGGYIKGMPTFTVKVATVSFYRNAAKGLPPGSGIFVVVNAVTGAPLGVFQENRYMTDLRTGGAGAVSMKHLSVEGQKTVGFLGTGAIARNMVRAAAAIRPGGYEGLAYGIDSAMAEQFASEMMAELGPDKFKMTAVSTAEELCGNADVIFTQTPGSSTVIEKSWLPAGGPSGFGTTIIASGSDQPTKQELPNDLLAASKYISDLTRQTSKLGELRGAMGAGVMTLDDVHAELGQVVNGDKTGREGDELIVVDLTGTGAQDAAIGQVAWDKLSML